MDCKRKKIGPLWSLQQGAQKCDRSFHLFTFFSADLNRREVVMGYGAVPSAEEWYLLVVGQPRGSGRKTHATRDLLIARELHVGYPGKTLHSTWRLCLSNMNFRHRIRNMSVSKMIFELSVLIYKVIAATGSKPCLSNSIKWIKSENKATWSMKATEIGPVALY